VHYDAGSEPASVAIGDLNGDQVPDLAVAGGDVSVLLGVGDGTFAAALHYPARSGPCSVAIGDLNGDRAPDLAVANSLSDNVSVLLNQLGCVGDLDGDGDTDLADLGILLADFGCAPPGPCAGDINGDGRTRLADLEILLADFGCAQ
jgi:hypothetical protein